VPEGGGRLVAAEWDFLGEGDFPITQEITDGSAGPLRTSNTFARAGTH
jgi:hypothetical protein